MQQNRILIDADEETGEKILLQIFTQTNIGPIFFEIIQRKGNRGFGEGNFTALLGGCSNGSFCDVTGDNRTPNYTLQVAPVPVTRTAGVCTPRERSCWRHSRPLGPGMSRATISKSNS